MSILFKNAKILTTVNDDFETIENGYLGVDGKTINYIGKERPSFSYTEEKDMYNKLFLPGLVNSHGHSAMNLLRGLGSGLPLDEWLHHLWPIEDIMRDEDFLSGMEMAVLEMLAGGTTSFCDMYMRPMVTQSVIEKSGIKADLTRVVMGGDDSTDYLKFLNRNESIEFYKTFNGAFDDRLHVDWSVHAEYTINERIASLWADEINTLGGRLHIHLSETQKERMECIERHGKSPVKWFNDLGFFNIPCYAAHSVWVDDEDLEIMKEKGVSPVHNPSSNLKLGSGFAPVKKMLELGLNVGLGTDGSASNNNLDMFEEMHIAALISSGYLRDPTALKAGDVLKMATENGAHLQGRDNTGSLAVGKDADIIAIDLDKPHLVPDWDTIALVIYSAHASDVVMTMVDGKILYENGEYLTLDRESIFSSYKKSVERLGKAIL